MRKERWSKRKRKAKGERLIKRGGGGGGRGGEGSDNVEEG